MKRALFMVFALIFALPAHAGWSITQDGAAIIENEGRSSIELRCDNNANTGYRPIWLLKFRTLNLNNLGVPQDVKFTFPSSRPFALHGENRFGAISFEGMNTPTQSDLNMLIKKLKAASNVTVSINNVGDLHKFSLKGSSKAIGTVAAACK